MRSCTLCPRECRINRLEGETGFCGLGPGAVLARALPHFGEEPPISGTAGAGTLFLTSCNLKCPFCQNYRISRDRMGEAVDREALAGVMLELAMKGCHNIELVTPTPQLAGRPGITACGLRVGPSAAARLQLRGVREDRRDPPARRHRRRLAARFQVRQRKRCPGVLRPGRLPAAGPGIDRGDDPTRQARGSRRRAGSPGGA